MWKTVEDLQRRLQQANLLRPEPMNNTSPPCIQSGVCVQKPFARWISQKVGSTVKSMIIHVNPCFDRIRRCKRSGVLYKDLKQKQLNSQRIASSQGSSSRFCGADPSQCGTWELKISERGEDPVGLPENMALC